MKTDKDNNSLITVMRYYLINEDNSLTKLAMSKVRKEGVSTKLSNGRKEFKIVSGYFYASGRKLEMLTGGVIYPLFLSDGEKVHLNHAVPYSYLNPLYVKNILKLEFKNRKIALLNYPVAILSSSIREIDMSKIDRIISDNDLLGEVRTASDRLSDDYHDSKEHRIKILENLKVLLEREVEQGLKKDTKLYVKTINELKELEEIV